MKYAVNLSVLAMVGLAACGQQVEVTSIDDSTAGQKVTDARDAIYDFTNYDYGYGLAEALPKTNLEPAPTSYVLFPTIKFDKPLDEYTPEFEADLKKKKKEQNERVKAYCLEHYKQFDVLPVAFEKDIFGNLVTFYWPFKAIETDAKAFLRDPALTLDARCTYLTKNYDFTRAEALLGTLGPNGEFSKFKGPVLVLDLGFDAVVVPMDNVKTENMHRIPDIWKQSIDDALKSAKLTRTEAIEKLSALDKEIAALEAKAKDPDVRKQARKAAAKEADEKKGERKSFLKRIFGKNSWGRAIACGFSGVVMKAASSFIPATDLLESKAKKWCEADDGDVSNDGG